MLTCRKWKPPCSLRDRRFIFLGPPTIYLYLYVCMYVCTYVRNKLSNVRHLICICIIWLSLLFFLQKIHSMCMYVYVCMYVCMYVYTSEYVCACYINNNYKCDRCFFFNKIYSVPRKLG